MTEVSAKGSMIIYTASDGAVQTEVRFEGETFWLSLNQIAILFERDKSVISRHLSNVFKDEELERNSVVAKNATTASDGKTYQIEYYNLDAILSVGYRVNSKRGTQFRIWANRILKEHLVQGYTLNEKRLQEKQEKIQQLYDSIRLVERSLLEQTENMDDARKVVCVLAEFANGLDLLDNYDHQQLEGKGNTVKPAVRISPEEFLAVVKTMRREFESDIFGKPKDTSFDSSVNQIYQSFNGSELYPSIENKAAILLYLVVKNHSFIDGNKRIAAAVFLYFLNRNQLLFTPSGKRRISNDGLAALTLLIAVSKPEEKETMVNIVITILNRSGI